MKIQTCDKCGGNLWGMKWNFFQIEEIPHYVIPRNEKLTFDLCNKCIKRYNKMIVIWMNER